MNDEYFMRQALKEAEKAADDGEVPVGAVAVLNGKIISRGGNKKEILKDTTAHAELICLQRASKKLKSWRLKDVTLYSTLEPCPMCAGATILSRIKKIIYGAKDPKAGAAGSVVNLFKVKKWNHHPKVQGGVLEKECKEILKGFFRNLRKKKKK